MVFFSIVKMILEYGLFYFTRNDKILHNVKQDAYIYIFVVCKEYVIQNGG